MDIKISRKNKDFFIYFYEFFIKYFYIIMEKNYKDILILFE